MGMIRKNTIQKTKGEAGIGMLVKWLKPLLEKLVYQTGVSFRLPTALLLIQLPGSVPGRTDTSVRLPKHQPPCGKPGLLPLALGQSDHLGRGEQMNDFFLVFLLLCISKQSINHFFKKMRKYVDY